jgi:hypothetical protein
MDAALWNAASMDEDDKRMCATRLMVPTRRLFRPSTL